MNRDKQKTGWRFDRRIPVAVVVVMVLQAAAALVWAGSTIERIAQMEHRQSGFEDLQERTARLEAEVRNIAQMLLRMDKKLDRLTSK